MDTISNVLTIIRNAGAVKHKTVEIDFSGLNKRLADILVENGFLSKADKRSKNGRKFIKLTLKYKSGKPIIAGLQRVSKPGKRIYRKCSELKKVKSGYGVGVISTSQGLMTIQQAKKKKLGGEVICEVW